MAKTLLAMGAHYDDCVYGVPGIMIKALRRHWRVVILTMIGDYSNWPPTKGRERQFRDGAAEICHRYGAEMRFLDFASHRFEVNMQTKRAVAEVVAEVEPDMGLYLWGADHHHDHVVASELSKIALRHGGRVLDVERFKTPRQIYCYDNGPRHTIGFVPDTFVNVSDEWADAIEWLGRFGALQRNAEFDAARPENNQRGKEVLAAYRGATCGARYAEALWAATCRPTEIL